MKILAISDEESPSLWDYYKPEKLEGVELILSCGDLKKEYLEFLVTMTGKPLLYVPGNHDKNYETDPPGGCECLDGRVMTCKGLRIAGLGGSARYNPGPYQYTEKEMRRRAAKLRFAIWRAGGVDIFISHAPPLGYGDADDYAHRGFQTFVDLIDRYHPRLFLHGHVHLRYGFQIPRTCTRGATTIHNVVGWQILEV